MYERQRGYQGDEACARGREQGEGRRWGCGAVNRGRPPRCPHCDFPIGPGKTAEALMRYRSLDRLEPVGNAADLHRLDDGGESAMTQDRSFVLELSQHRPRRASTFFRVVSAPAIVLLSMLVGSCDRAPTTPREQLIQSLKGADTEGYDFEIKETASEEVASLTNPAVKSLIKLDAAAPNLILKFTRVTDKNTKRTTT